MKGTNSYQLIESYEYEQYNKNFDDWVDTRTRIYEKANINSDGEDHENREPLKIKINSKQPGAGKTLSMVEYLKEHPDEKTLIVAPSHEFLEEIKQSFGRNMKRLLGFEKACKRNLNNRTYYEKTKNVSPSLFCENEKCKGWCTYRNQFDQIKNGRYNIVGMPFQFLMHDDIDFNQYDNIFIEERVSSPKYCQWNKEEILKEISKLYTKSSKKEIENGIGSIDLETLNEVKKCITDTDLKKFQDLYDNLVTQVSIYNKKVIDNSKKKGDNSKINFEKLCQVNVSELYFCLAFMNDNIYKNGQVEIPWEYVIFYKQLKSGKQLNFNCASFIENKFFHYLNEFEEMYPEHVAKVEINETMYENKNTVIRKRSGGIYKKNSEYIYKNHYRDRLDRLIKREKHNKKKKVCILSYKDLVKETKKINGLRSENNLSGADGFWFGASHGVNSYRDYEVLIVYGDFLPAPDHYINHILRFYPEEDLPDFHINSGFENKQPKDSRLLELYEEFQQDVYDSVHRLRPLSNNIDIFWYGSHIPSSLLKEFDFVDESNG